MSDIEDELDVKRPRRPSRRYSTGVMTDYSAVHAEILADDLLLGRRYNPHEDENDQQPRPSRRRATRRFSTGVNLRNVTGYEDSQARIPSGLESQLAAPFHFTPPQKPRVRQATSATTATTTSSTEESATEEPVKKASESKPTTKKNSLPSFASPNASNNLTTLVTVSPPPPPRPRVRRCSLSSQPATTTTAKPVSSTVRRRSSLTANFKPSAASVDPISDLSDDGVDDDLEQQRKSRRRQPRRASTASMPAPPNLWKDEPSQRRSSLGATSIRPVRQPQRRSSLAANFAPPLYTRTSEEELDGSFRGGGKLCMSPPPAAFHENATSPMAPRPTYRKYSRRRSLDQPLLTYKTVASSDEENQAPKVDYSYRTGNARRRSSLAANFKPEPSSRTLSESSSSSASSSAVDINNKLRRRNASPTPLGATNTASVDPNDKEQRLKLSSGWNKVATARRWKMAKKWLPFVLILALCGAVYDARSKAQVARQEMLQSQDERAQILLQIQWMEERAGRHAQVTGDNLASRRTNENVAVSDLHSVVQTMQSHIQATAKTHLLEKYGPGPIRVVLDLDLDGQYQIAVEIPSIDSAPHAIWTFLEQIETQAWDGAKLESPSATRAGLELHAETSDSSKLEFIEGATDESLVPAHSLCLGLAKHGLDLALNHGEKHRDNEVCIGRIVEGADSFDRLLVLHEASKFPIVVTNVSVLKTQNAEEM